MIAANPGALKKADVVLVTDGGSDAQMAPKLRERANILDVTIIGLGIGVEREWLAPWCDDIQVVTDLNHIDDTSAEMLFARQPGINRLPGFSEPSFGRPAGSEELTVPLQVRILTSKLARRIAVAVMIEVLAALNGQKPKR